MRWLMHGSVTDAAAAALRRHGDQATRAADVGVAEGAFPVDILKLAESKQLDIVTADPEFAGAPYQLRIPFNRSIVFLQLAGGDVEQDDAIDRLYARYKRLAPGRLYTVTENRVKVRQLPGRK